MKRIVIFGASGFVGSTILGQLYGDSAGEEKKKYEVVSVSRRGVVPAHLEKESWAKDVEWVKGNALNPEDYKDLLSEDTSLIVTSGSPPLPQTSQEGTDEQRRNNGETCKTVIDTAASQGVSRIVLLGAAVPAWAPVGYREGKEMAKEALEKFAEKPGNDGILLQPTAIYGTRHTESGSALPIKYVLAPISSLLSGLKSVGFTNLMTGASPWAFANFLEPFVPVDNVAKACIQAATTDLYKGKGFVVVSAEEIGKDFN